MTKLADICVVDANTSAIEVGITVYEGETGGVSCVSVGVPVPTIFWTVNHRATHFSQTDGFNNVSVTGDVVTPGIARSTLQIVDAQYPDDGGVYICTGSNAQFADSFATIYVEVLGMWVIIRWHN